MSNLKKYNLFILITSFAKLLVEIFIPLLLFDKGFTIERIILFLIFKYAFCILIIPFTLKLGNKYSYTKLMLISSILFTFTYVYLNILTKHVFSLVFLALIFSAYLIFYWIGRHIYALTIIEDKKTTDNVSLYAMFSIIGGIPATYIGAKILNTFGFVTLTIIVFILMFISIIPLIKIKDINIKTKEKLNLKKVIHTFPKRNYLFIIIEQLRYISISIFPLFVYIYVKKEFNFLGLINIISGIGSVIYIYILSKKMDKNKKDYLKASSILLGVVYTLKINIINPSIFLAIIFIEGLAKSALDTIVLRNTYAYGKNYDAPSYIGFIELLNNISRTLILLIFYILKLDLKIIIIVSIIGIIFNAFIKFDDGKYGYTQSK